MLNGSEEQETVNSSLEMENMEATPIPDPDQRNEEVHLQSKYFVYYLNVPQLSTEGRRCSKPSD